MPSPPLFPRQILSVLGMPSVCLGQRLHLYPVCVHLSPPKKARCSQRDEGNYPKGEMGFCQVMAAARNRSKINSPKAGSYFKRLLSSCSQYCLFFPTPMDCGSPGVTQVLPLPDAQGWVKLLWGILPGSFVTGRKRIER